MLDKIKGRVWKFGDDINTELMIPAQAIALPDDKAARLFFSANRPGWVDLVKPGDIMVGGRNFGTGSSRPGAKMMRILGISCVVAEEINGLFLRNCVNFGLPALPCPGVSNIFEEGDVAEVDFKTGKVKNVTKGTEVSTSPLPNSLLRIVEAGGIVPLLEKEGCLEPQAK